MVIFQYNLYIFGIHLWTVLCPKPCYNESCYNINKEVVVYFMYKLTEHLQVYPRMDTAEDFDSIS